MLIINNKKLILFISAVFFSLALSGCDAKKEITKSTKTVDIKEWKTKNGVRVLYVHAPELPMIDIKAIFDAGSVRDDGKFGIAQLSNGLLNHGAQLGDKVLTVDDISERFENIGARYGSGVSKDYATISLRTLTDEKLLKMAITTLKAIINNPTYDEKEFVRVRKQLLVAFEGRKQSPGTIASDAFYKYLYSNHPYANPSIGSEESIKELSRNDLFSFYKKYYVAANALVTIVGDVDRKKAEELAEEIVGGLASGEKPLSLPLTNEMQKASSKHHEFPSSQTHILVGQLGVHRKDKDYFTLYVANHILGGSGFGSRIMEEIREKRGLAYSSYSYFSPMLKRGPFVMGMQTSNKNTNEAMKILNETLENYINNGPTEKELLHSKKNITGGFPLRIDSNSDISNYLSVIGFYDLPLSYLKDFNGKVEAVTLEQIKETLKRRINPKKMITITVGNKENNG